MRICSAIKYVACILALLAVRWCAPVFASENYTVSEKEVRQKLLTAISDPASRFQKYGAAISPDETAGFLIKTLSITKSRSSGEPLILFCGAFSGPLNRPDIEDDMSNDVCGVFDLKNSLVYILSDKVRHGVSIRPFPLSKTTDFVLLDGVCGFDCQWEGLSELFAYNGPGGGLEKIWDVSTYRHVSADGCDSSSDYIDRGVLSEGVRGAENMREIVLSISREDRHSEPPQDIKEIKEWYSWKNGRPYLVQRIENSRPVLDRAAGERLYAVSKIDVSTAVPGRMGLIDYLGDENPMVTEAADHAIYSHMYSMEKTGQLDYPMVRELVRRYLDKNSPCRGGAENLLSQLWSFNGFSLEKEEKDMLWNAYGRTQDDLILQLLSSAGDARVLASLLEQFAGAVEKKDACAADDAYARINTLAGKGVPLGDTGRSMLQRAARANLVCNNGDAEWNVSKNIAVWLNPTLRKLPEGCAPWENFPEVMQKIFPVREEYSGRQLLLGTGMVRCQDTAICKTFTKSQMENLLLDNLASSGEWIDDSFLNNYADPALFGLEYCRLEADYVKFMHETEEKMILSSKYSEQKELKALLSPMLGEWCGLTPKNGTRVQAQVRIGFVQDKEMIKGVGTITFAHIGAADYTSNIILVPMSYEEIAKTKEVQFSEVSRYTPGQAWQLRVVNGSVYLNNAHWGDTLLSHVCDGFWKEGQ